METAGEGGLWGVAVLAAYMRSREAGESLEDYRQGRVFSAARSSHIVPAAKGVEGFRKYMERYIACLPAQQAAGNMK